MADEDVSLKNRARRALHQRLESLQRAGLADVPKAPVADAAPSSRAGGTAGEGGCHGHSRVAMPPEDAADSHAYDKRGHGTHAPQTPQTGAVAELAVLAARVAVCTRCAELARTRKQTVFGVGNPTARLVFLGEAPGADEDRQGEPFVGRAGQLLTKIIEACTLRRQDVYILNVLKCRPPENRNPLPEEAANCREYLDAQLAILQPEYICCLGAVAARNLLETDAGISKMRGKFYLYNGIKVLCTYHPAYLLRNPAAKRQVWEDMQFLMAEMGIELPERA